MIPCGLLPSSPRRNNTSGTTRCDSLRSGPGRVNALAYQMLLHDAYSTNQQTSFFSSFFVTSTSPPPPIFRNLPMAACHPIWGAPLAECILSNPTDYTLYKILNEDISENNCGLLRKMRLTRYAERRTFCCYAGEHHDTFAFSENVHYV